MGVRYKTKVYQVVRSECMRKINESNGGSIVQMTAQEKRVLITRAVADVHERLAKSGAFRRAFIATGTWLPPDELSGLSVSLQGLNFDYNKIISTTAVEAHIKVVQEENRKAEIERAKIEAERVAAQRKREEKKLILEAKFQSATERSHEI